jgi:hypothetical protein
MPRSQYLIGGLAAGLALLLAACGGTGLNADGPLGPSTPDVGGQCFPTPKGDVGTFADLEFGNGGGPARISRVTLAHARHLQLVAAWVVPVTGTDLWGAFDGYPPNGIAGPEGNRGVPGEHWNQRQRADGAVIPHLRGQDVENLVLVLKPIGPEGSASTEYVWYTSGGSRYVLNLGVRVLLFDGVVNGCATHGY